MDSLRHLLFDRNFSSPATQFFDNQNHIVQEIWTSLCFPLSLSPSSGEFKESDCHALFSPHLLVLVQRYLTNLYLSDKQCDQATSTTFSHQHVHELHELNLLAIDWLYIPNESQHSPLLELLYTRCKHSTAATPTVAPKTRGTGVADSIIALGHSFRDIT